MNNNNNNMRPLVVPTAPGGGGGEGGNVESDSVTGCILSGGAPYATTTQATAGVTMSPAPNYSATPTASSSSQQQQHPNNNNTNKQSAMLAQHQQHMMGLMSANPALAAAVAASGPLFPSQAATAFMSNPHGVFFAPAVVGITAAAAGCGVVGQNGAPSFQQQQQQPLSHHHHPSVMLPSSCFDPMQQHFAASSSQQQSASGGALSVSTTTAGAAAAQPEDMPSDDRAQQYRDRNREHARSARIRKKAYVQKLKELVEHLHAERTEEARQRRVANQRLAVQQNARRGALLTFFALHCSANYETSSSATVTAGDHPHKWSTVLEDSFWLKQPVTPYRSFRRAEIEKECRISRGIEAVMHDGASLSVMIESIGCQSARWMQLKREEFLLLFEQAKQRGGSNNKKMPRCIKRQESRLQHAISSLSSSSASSSNNASISSSTGGEQEVPHPPMRKMKKQKTEPKEGTMIGPNNNESSSGHATAKGDSDHKGISSSGGSDGGSGGNNKNTKQDSSKDFHDYHAKPLPDPKLGDSERSSGSSPSEDSPAEESNESSNGDGKRPKSADSSSGDDSAAAAVEPRAAKRRKSEPKLVETLSQQRCSTSNSLPLNVAKKGGIQHNIRSIVDPAGNNGAAKRFCVAPAIALPPFAGLGSKRQTAVPPLGAALSLAGSKVAALRSVTEPTEGFGTQVTISSNSPIGVVPNHNNGGAAKGPNVISMDAETTSSKSDGIDSPKIRGNYHINEDDMIMMDSVLMCPFVFRTQDAVLCGAFAECAMPGMLRAHFSVRDKLQSLELVYDAMGFMQQLERAGGNEVATPVIPGSLEMALVPNSNEARVITMAQPPYLIVNVNEVWTRTTGYTQMDVEGAEYLQLLEGDGTVATDDAKKRPGRPAHLLELVAKGQPACSTNIHYDSDGCDFVEFVCSYPLTNSCDTVTHILHVSKELPSFPESQLLRHANDD